MFTSLFLTLTVLFEVIETKHIFLKMSSFKYKIASLQKRNLKNLMNITPQNGFAYIFYYPSFYSLFFKLFASKIRQA